MHQLQYSVLVNCGLTAVPSVLGRIFYGTGEDEDLPLWEQVWMWISLYGDPRAIWEQME